MPIYAYRCTSCGHAKDVLQKVSDPLLTECPACGAATFAKQVTAAGFQLKGSGWYVTDFRGGNGGAAKGAEDGKADGKTEGASEAKAEDKPDKPAEKAADKAPATKPESAPAPAAPAPAPSSGT
jgi:putative FmdB family regulatory protein